MRVVIEVCIEVAKLIVMATFIMFVVAETWKLVMEVL